MKSFEKTYRELQIKGYKNEDAMFKAFEKVKKNFNNMKQRLYNRIYEIQKEKGYFITLTYKGDTPNIEKAHKQLKRWCVVNCNLYVGNIDFGEINDRIHHHVVCVPKHNNLVGSWKYGSINILKIRDSKVDGRKAVMYVSKLMNHAIKETADYIIRSKKIKKGDI